MRFGSILAGSLVLFLVCGAPRALAQTTSSESTPAAPEPAVPPPPAPTTESLSLRDGTRLEGTVVERTDTRIVLRLASGELRHVPLSAVGPVPEDVVRARVTGAPGLRLYTWNGERVSARAVETYETYEVQLPGGGARMGQARVASDVQGDDDRFRLLCPVPCDAELLRGRHLFGVGDGEGDPLPVDSAVFLLDPAVELRVSLERNDVLRGLGDALLIAGSIATLVFLVAADQLAPNGMDAGWTIAGVSAGVITLGAGVPLVMLENGARVEQVVPDEAR